jgi:hypothetical protein
MTQAELNLLWEACALLSIEASDHEHNKRLDKDRRLAVAQTLRAFIIKACKVMGVKGLADITVKL